MNVSKLTKKDLADVVEQGEGAYRFQGEKIEQIDTSEGVRYCYASKSWSKENNFSTLLKAVKAYNKLFK